MRTGPRRVGGFCPCLVSTNRYWYEIGVTLKFPMLKVGSTVRGLNVWALQQNRCKSCSCLSLARTQNGSAPTLTSRMKAVLLFLAWAFDSLRRQYHGSSYLPRREIFFTPQSSAPPVTCLRVRSFACCLFLGSWPNPTQACMPPRALSTTSCTASRGYFRPLSLLRASFVLSHVRTYCCVSFFREFSCGAGSTECSTPLLNEYWIKQ